LTAGRCNSGAATTWL